MTGLSLYLERFDRPASAYELSAQEERMREIEEARSQAYQDGVEAGRAQAVEDREQTNETLTQMLACLDAEINNLPSRVRSEVAEMTAKIAAAIFPSFADENLARHLITLIEQMGEPIADTKIRIKTPSTYHNKVSTLLAEAGYEDRVKVEEDETASGPIADIIWADGGMKVNFDEAISTAIEALNSQQTPCANESFGAEIIINSDAANEEELPSLGDFEADVPSGAEENIDETKLSAMPVMEDLADAEELSSVEELDLNLGDIETIDDAEPSEDELETEEASPINIEMAPIEDLALDDNEEEAM